MSEKCILCGDNASTAADLVRPANNLKKIRPEAIKHPICPACSATVLTIDKNLQARFPLIFRDVPYK